MKWMMVVTLLLRWSIVSSEAKPNWRPILRMKDLDDDASDKTYYFLGNSARDIMIKLLQWNQECRASFLDPTCNDDDC